MIKDKINEIIDINCYKKIEKIVKKYKYSNKYIAVRINNKVIYNNEDIDKYKKGSYEYWMIHAIHALNIKDIEERYKYIYDIMCEYIDTTNCVLCKFKNDRCEAQRCHKAVHDIDGCCYFRNMGFCPFFDREKKCCTKKSISCKLFMCEYIEKKYKFRSIPKNYILLRLFFNSRCLEILRHSYRKNFEEIKDKLIKYSRSIRA